MVTLIILQMCVSKNGWPKIHMEIQCFAKILICFDISLCHVITTNCNVSCQPFTLQITRAWCIIDIK